MPIFNNALAGAAGSGGADAEFKIERSLRFNSSDDSRLDNSMSTGGNRNKFTFSFWVKFALSDYAILSAGTDSSGYFEFKFNSDSKLEIHGENITNTQTVAQFRDPAAWYHVMLVIDKSNSTATDRAIIYVNGERQTLSTTSQANTSNVYWGHANQPHRIGGRTWGGGNEANYYLAEFHHLDGIAATPSDFGGLDDNDVWQPKEYGGNYGTIGFHLDFSDNTSTTTIAEDSSGNNNDWTANNLSVASGAGNDSLIDTPTNADANSGNNIGNYATMSPVGKTKTQYFTENGNLVCGNSSVPSGSSGSRGFVPSTIGFKTGKWYAEVQTTAASDGDVDFAVGIYPATSTGYYSTSGHYAMRPTGHIYSPSGTHQSYGSAWTDSDIIGIAVDMDSSTKTVQFFKNGSSMASATTIADAEYFFGYGADGGGSGRTYKSTWNFGQRPFAYTPPTGFKSLCTQNLPDPGIDKGSDYFEAKPYDGTGETLNVTGLDFEPDLVYTATYNATGYIKYIWDDVRGATKALATSHTQGDDAEITVSNGLTSFNSDGFTVGDNTQLNENSSRKMIAWCWAGGSAFSNSAGSNDATIASSGIVNHTAGFSIVSYTGTGSNATIRHGLNAAPEFLITKDRDNVASWHVQHSALGNTKAIFLNSYSAAVSNGAYWNNTSPTSSVFSVGTADGMNGSENDYIAYCFTPIEGYSSFGKVEGNGLDDGPFIYTGFKPAFVMIKALYAYSGGSDIIANTSWYIYDNARSPFNPNGNVVAADLNADEENNSTDIDFLSNGFKIRNTRSINTTNDAIYVAFAEHPFKTARAA